MIVRTLDEAEVYCRTPKFLKRYFSALDRLKLGEIKSLPELCEAVGLADEAAASWLLYGFESGIVQLAGFDHAGREIVKIPCGNHFRTLFVKRVLHS